MQHWAFWEGFSQNSLHERGVDHVLNTRLNEEREEKKLIKLLEKHRGSIGCIERMGDEQREKFFEEFEKKNSSEIFRKYVD